MSRISQALARASSPKEGAEAQTSPPAQPAAPAPRHIHSFLDDYAVEAEAPQASSEPWVQSPPEKPRVSRPTSASRPRGSRDWNAQLRDDIERLKQRIDAAMEP